MHARRFGLRSILSAHFAICGLEGTAAVERIGTRQRATRNRIREHGVAAGHAGGRLRVALLHERAARLAANVGQSPRAAGAPAGAAQEAGKAVDRRPPARAHR
ncbi:hypothetical protein ON010_g18621 [Phytophthora cinnamomi]|nr:hypothetical protein ON010_g18621 [Phytophthora cinnamomi]